MHRQRIQVEYTTCMQFVAIARANGCALNKRNYIVMFDMNICTTDKRQTVTLV